MENTIENTNLSEAQETQEETTEKMYTAEEVEKLMQANADRRVNQALAKQKREYEKKLSLTSLDESKRAEAEKDLRIQELQEQLVAFQKEKNKSEIKSVLGSRGLNAEFADLLVITEDAEENQSAINKFDKLFKAAVSAEVNKRLAAAGNVPKSGVSEEKITKDKAKRMSMSELNKLAETNPSLFAEIFGN